MRNLIWHFPVIALPFALQEAARKFDKDGDLVACHCSKASAWYSARHFIPVIGRKFALHHVQTALWLRNTGARQITAPQAETIADILLGLVSSNIRAYSAEGDLVTAMDLYSQVLSTEGVAPHTLALANSGLAQVEWLLFVLGKRVYKAIRKKSLSHLATAQVLCDQISNTLYGQRQKVRVMRRIGEMHMRLGNVDAGWKYLRLAAHLAWKVSFDQWIKTRWIITKYFLTRFRIR